VAGRVSPKLFYWALALVAVAGGGWIWVAANRTPANTYATPLPASEIAAAAGFPGYVLGSDSAPVVVDDYSDFECPFCAELAILTFPDVRSRLISAGMVRWRFHDRPLTSIHPKTLAAHEAAACAAEQDKFWDMQDQLYSHQGAWVAARNSEKNFADYARALGLNMDQYNQCIRSHRYLARIQASAQHADELGITSTPTLFINGQPYDITAHGLSYDSLRVAIAAAAQRGAAAKAAGATPGAARTR
jgi:protein-disulfide isomerase